MRSPTPALMQQQQQQQQHHLIMEDEERKEEERRETIHQRGAASRRASNNNNNNSGRQHEWDADAAFPIQEIQRIRNKTKKLRGAGQLQQQQQQDDNEAFSVEQPVEFPLTTTTAAAAAGKSARRSQDRRRFWFNSHGSSDDGSRGQFSQQQQQQQQQQRSGGAASSDGTTVGTTTDAETDPPATSRAANKAQKQLLQDFRRPRAVSTDDTSTSILSGSADAVESRLAHPSNKHHKQKQQLETSVNTTHNTTASTSTSYEDDSDDPNLGLHDLCGEAVTTDDIAWRNALHLLSLEPQLAAVVDGQGWTPLHISCLGAAPPPPYMLRALLYVHPGAAQLRDDGGRLPLHLVAASSADTAAMQLLLQEYPAAVSVRDEHGLTPMHLLLRNKAVPLQLRAVQVALGLSVNETMDDNYEHNSKQRRRNSCYNRRKQSQSRSRSHSRSRSRGHTSTKSSDEDDEEVDRPYHHSNHILQRRRQHLNLTLEQLEDWRRRQHATVTTNLLNHNELAHERHFATYPHDVQVALRQLAHWKHRQRQRQQQHETDASGDGEVGIEVQLPATATTADDAENSSNRNSNNPAAIPFPGKSRQLPIHMLVQRAFLDVPAVHESRHCDVEDDDESTTKKSTTISKKRAAAKMQQEEGEVASNSRDEEQHKVDDDDDDGEWDGDSSEDDDEEEILSILDRYRNFAKKKKTKAKSKSNHHKPCPSSVPHAVSVLRLLAAVYPEGLTVRDGHGHTPLLQVLTHERAPLPDAELVEILLGTHLQFRDDENARLPAWAADLPLHLLLQNNRSSSDDSGSSKYHRYTNAAMLAHPDTGQLPLHLAAEELASDAAVMAAIRQAYPGAVSAVDHRGRTPLHLALQNFRRVPVDPRVVEILFSDRVAHIRDDYGQLPLDLLVEQQRHHRQLLLPRSKMPNEENYGTGDSTTTTTTTTNSIYQRLVRASILGAARPETPSQRSTLLRRLRRLPVWLRRDACATTVVQDLLVEDVLAYPWQCAYILCDGALLVALISVFRLQMKEFLDTLESDEVLSTWYTYAVYATATVRLCGLLVQGGLAVSLGDFGHLCGCNLCYWLDVWAMLFSVVTSAFLYSAASDERLLALGTASTCLLWASLIGYLSNWWHGMAVFSGGFSKIAYRMVSPLICAGILVVASAQCFFTLLQLECVDAMGFAPVCSVRDAYRIVFMLLRGDPFIDSTGVADLSTGAILMVATVLVVFVVFLLALLVTILISAARLDFDDIALGSYWEPKLAFVLYSEDLGLSRRMASAVQTDESHHYSFVAKQARAWDVYMQTLFGVEPEKGSNWFARPMHSTVLTWITAIFVIPIWLVLGLATLGLIWPPQLRQWLFRPAWRQIEYSRSNRRAAEQATPQIVAIRDELMQLKMMSYEKSNGIENELRELKELLRSVVQE